jgi:hypothetical protein
MNEKEPKFSRIIFNFTGLYNNTVFLEEDEEMINLSGADNPQKEELACKSVTEAIELRRKYTSKHSGRLDDANKV